jgi:LPS O-antigen subunit length determinant protein (WzzB/FepE family)
MPKFDDDENIKLDKQIRINTYEMTKKIKECEEVIKEISMQKIENIQESTSII